MLWWLQIIVVWFYNGVYPKKRNIILVWYKQGQTFSDFYKKKQTYIFRSVLVEFNQIVRYTIILPDQHNSGTRYEVWLPSLLMASLLHIEAIEMGRFKGNQECVYSDSIFFLYAFTFIFFIKIIKVYLRLKNL